MKRNKRHNLIKRLQSGLPRGAPFDVAALGRLGISAQAASHYVKEGWLVRLGRGVYAFPGDTLSAHGMVKLLQARIDGLHVGGKSALALHGVRHNLAVRETLVLLGDARFVLPGWFTARQPARYVAAKLFDWTDEELSKRTLGTPPGVADGLLVSAPERAAIEMLYEVGVHESVEEARLVFEGLRNLRADVAGRLLSCCSSVKAVRLFLKLSRETGLLDVDALKRRHTLRVGSDRRWIGRLNDGTTLTLKPYG